jgi:hypothetical protein
MLLLVLENTLNVHDLMAIDQIVDVLVDEATK